MESALHVVLPLDHGELRRDHLPVPERDLGNVVVLDQVLKLTRIEAGSVVVDPNGGIRSEVERKILCEPLGGTLCAKREEVVLYLTDDDFRAVLRGRVVYGIGDVERTEIELPAGDLNAARLFDLKRSSDPLGLLPEGESREAALASSAVQTSSRLGERLRSLPRVAKALECALRALEGDSLAVVGDVDLFDPVQFIFGESDVNVVRVTV
jgi:hypothetical protein